MTVFRRPASPSAAAAGDAIPFAHDGRMHLFYLSSPTGPLDYPGRVRTTWQHAVTDDLERWDELAPAVLPSDAGGFDGGGIWTGSVVEHGGVFHLFYTGHHVGAEHPQTICLATSTDLVSFEKVAENPVLLPTAGFEAVDWRDPYVFYNAAEGVWWMLIAARLATGPTDSRGCIVLATSPDLMTWTVEPEPLYSPGTTYCPECPELWQDEQGFWQLVYSRFSEEVGTVSRFADSPRGPFREPSRPDLGGRRWYAAKSAPDLSGDGRIFFGWIHDRVTDERGTRWLWGGDFALPRRARSTSDGSLDISPAVLPGRSNPTSAPQTLDGVGGSETVGLVDVAPERLGATLRFAPDADATVLGFEIAGPDRSGWRLDLVIATGEVRLRRQPTPMDDFWADLTGRQAEYREVDGEFVARARIVPVRGEVEVEVILDGELLEVYVAGQAALTHRIQREPGMGLLAFVVSGTATVDAVVGALFE